MIVRGDPLGATASHVLWGILAGFVLAALLAWLAGAGPARVTPAGPRPRRLLGLALVASVFLPILVGLQAVGLFAAAAMGLLAPGVFGALLVFGPVVDAAAVLTLATLPVLGVVATIANWAYPLGAERRQPTGPRRRFRAGWIGLSAGAVFVAYAELSKGGGVDPSDASEPDALVARAGVLLLASLPGALISITVATLVSRCVRYVSPVTATSTS